MTTGELAINGGEPVRTEPFGPRWIMGEEEKRQLGEVIDNSATGWLSRFKVQEFSDRFAARHGVKYAVPVNSGTTAIHTALAAIDPEPGDEVITTPTTDMGGVLGIMLQNCVAVFADWDSETFNTDPVDIERRITERTRAILVTHLFGNPCDMDAIIDIGRSHGIPVIEDCAQSHLAEYQGQVVGSISDMGVFSFGSKTLTAGQGGMVITNDEGLARRALGFSRKGAEVDANMLDSQPTSLQRGSLHGFAFLGDFNPMVDLQAAVGLAQMDRWDEATETRIRTAAILDEVVHHLPGFKAQKVRPGDLHTYLLYVFTIEEEEAGVSPFEFADAVRAEGIPDINGPYLEGLPLYKYPIFAEGRTYGKSQYPFVDEQGNRRVDYNKVSLPEVERTLPKTARIGFRNSFTDQDAHDIAAAIRKVSDYFASRR